MSNVVSISLEEVRQYQQSKYELFLQLVEKVRDLATRKVFPYTVTGPVEKLKIMGMTMTELQNIEPTMLEIKLPVDGVDLTYKLICWFKFVYGSAVEMDDLSDEVKIDVVGAKGPNTTRPKFVTQADCDAVFENLKKFFKIEDVAVPA